MELFTEHWLLFFISCASCVGFFHYGCFCERRVWEKEQAFVKASQPSDGKTERPGDLVASARDLSAVITKRETEEREKAQASGPVVGHFVMAYVQFEHGRLWLARGIGVLDTVLVEDGPEMLCRCVAAVGASGQDAPPVHIPEPTSRAQ